MRSSKSIRSRTILAVASSLSSSMTHTWQFGKLVRAAETVAAMTLSSSRHGIMRCQLNTSGSPPRVAGRSV